MSRPGKRRRKAAQRRGDGWRCHYCNRWFGKKSRTGRTTTLDHVIPRALGGPNAAWNQVLACRQCNEEKADRTYEAFTGSDQLPKQCHEWYLTTAEFVNQNPSA